LFGSLSINEFAMRLQQGQSFDFIFEMFMLKAANYFRLGLTNLFYVYRLVAFGTILH